MDNLLRCYASKNREEDTEQEDRPWQRGAGPGHPRTIYVESGGITGMEFFIITLKLFQIHSFQLNLLQK